MSERTPPENKKPDYRSEAERQAARRAERSAEQLRANLQRRKAQTRARREGLADEAEGLPAAGSAGDAASSDGGDKQGG